MKNVNYKKIICIMLSGFVLTTTGCQKKVVTNETKFEENVDTKSSDITASKVEDLKEIEETMEEETEDIKEDTKENNYTEEDVVKYFTDCKDAIIASEKTQSAKQKTIDLFIKMTDFIFYDSEIYGFTFKQLKDGTKENIKETYYEVDAIIEKRYPNYKDTLSSKYARAKDWLKEKYNNTKDKVTQNLDSETLNDIDDAKKNISDATSNIKDITGSIYEDEKVKVKSWYEDFRSRHE